MSATLPDEHALAAQEERAWSSLRSLLGAHSDPLLWAVAPKLAIACTGVDAGRGPSGARAAVTAAARARWRPGPRITLVDEVAFLTTSTGQARTLRPIVAALADGRTAVAAELPPARPSAIRRAVAASRRLAPVLHEWSRTMAPSRVDAATEVLTAALACGRLAEWLDTSRVRRLVVATQHNTTARAALLEARARHLPTAYVPHAPAADVPWYRDLPADLALLRGQGEVAFYTGLGAPAARAVAVGDAAIEETGERAIIRADAPLVWATSPQPKARLRAIVSILEATGLPIEVAPHPRSDRRMLAVLCPATWRWSRHATTGDRLVRDPLVGLVQHRSGVGLEAVMRGVPVLEICAPGRPTPYLYLQELGAQVSSAADIRAALSSLAPVDDLLSASGRWCASRGTDAAEVVASHLSTVSAAEGPVLEGWPA